MVRINKYILGEHSIKNDSGILWGMKIKKMT